MIDREREERVIERKSLREIDLGRPVKGFRQKSMKRAAVDLDTGSSKDQAPSLDNISLNGSSSHAESRTII